MADLVYVDEQKEQARQVLRSAVASDQFTQNEVVEVIPAAKIEETIELILAHECKVLITDYRLSDHKPDVQYTGADLIREFQKRFDRFPCFVTTSFTGEAVDDELDTNMIFPKSDFLNSDGYSDTSSGSELPFFTRVRKKINEYERFVSHTTKEWEQLSAKSENEVLSAEEAERLIQLDDLVEAFHGRSHAIESHIKQKALEPFQQIIEKAEKLIQEIEDKTEAD